MSTAELAPAARADVAPFALARPRLVELDLLRGLAVAGMILVTSPGSWSHAYPQLKHAAWHGWTLADMVFPTFLFAVGAALGLSLPKILAAGRPSAFVWAKVARRTLALIALGLFLNILPDFDLAGLRIPGILQRIALCYAAAAGLCLLTARRGGLNVPAIVAAMAGLLVGYWTILALVPAPGFEPGRLDSYGSLPAWVDRTVFTIPHIWDWGLTEGRGKTYDPEGLLSTLGALFNVLAGVLAGQALQRSPTGRTVGRLAMVGLALFVAGVTLDRLLPINKPLFTSSFALLSTGFSMLTLAVLSAWLRAAPGPMRAGAYPLQVLGGNAILAFVLSQVIGAYWGLEWIGGADQRRSLQAWAFEGWSRIIDDPLSASLAVALTMLVLITALLVPLHRRGVHLRL